jgi:hypothetical protein
MRLAAALMFALATTACASWDKSETIVTEIGRVPVEEAIGLPRVELETRLGLGPAEQVVLSSAWLEESVLVERFSMFDISQQRRCPSGRFPDLRFARAGKTWFMPSLIYRDGALSALGNEPPVGDDPTQPAFLTATCTTHHRSGKQTGEDLTALAVYAPVLLPVGGLLHTINAVGSIGSPDINAALAQLPLGAAPPGGLEAWLAKSPPGARVVSREGDTVRVELCRRTCEDRAMDLGASVTFVNGVVMRLDGGGCTLTPARTFRCKG